MDDRSSESSGAPAEQGDARIQRVRRAIRHDLRNPLTIILGRCELLESGALGAVQPAQAESLRAIARNADRLTREIDALAQLLDEVLHMDAEARPRATSAGAGRGAPDER